MPTAGGQWAAAAKARASLAFHLSLGRRSAYPSNMTKLLEKAVQAVRQLPDDAQDAIATAMLALAEPEEIDPADLPGILESLAQARRRQFAPEAEIESAFRHFDP
jgi:hypothetical protein